MADRVTRGAMLAGAAATAAALAGSRRPASADAANITGVTWGGPWIQAWQSATAKQNAAQVNWVLHAAATTAIVARIKADWPNTQFDFVQATATTFYSMMREGWLSPLTPAMIPNMADLPAGVMIKDPAGNVVAIPSDLSTVFWTYDQNALGMTVSKPEDLLSPKLRGKIMLNTPTIASASQLVSLARARGGDEHHIDPGFDFIKDLIKAGNIGRVVKTDADVSTAFTTGQVAIGVVNGINYHVLSQHVNLTLLNKVPGSNMFKTYVGSEGFAVLKRTGNRKPVYDFLNFCLSPGIDSDYAATIGALPSNRHGTVSPEMAPLRLSPQEVPKFAIYPDTDYISSQTANWNQKWELEIDPLL